jgi:hypothetical protein
MPDYKVGDVVRVRHSFLMNRHWKIVQILPSFNKRILLYKVQLLFPDGSLHQAVRPFAVTSNLIIEHLGGYTEWLETLQKNSRA